MTNVLEQACNRYLQTEEFPTSYEDLQPVPLQEVAQLTFAGDDGMKVGQTYRARSEVTQFCDLQSRQELSLASLWLRLRSPDEQGKWAWGAWSQEIALPQIVCSYFDQGATTQAPTLREIRSDDGQCVAVLDLILEVPAQAVSSLNEVSRVLGWDWGVRSAGGFCRRSCFPRRGRAHSRCRCGRARRSWWRGRTTRRHGAASRPSARSCSRSAAGASLRSRLTMTARRSLRWWRTRTAPGWSGEAVTTRPPWQPSSWPWPRIDEVGTHASHPLAPLPATLSYPRVGGG